MHRDSRVISKVQAPKIRVIHLLPPTIHHADVADFRDLVQRLTGKNGGKVKGKGKRVKQGQEDMTMIRCDHYPTVILPKDEAEAEIMGTPAGSSSSSDHHQDLHQYHPSSSPSSSRDDHNNNMFAGGGYIPTLDDVHDDGFDFTTLFNFDGRDHHDQSSSGDGDHENDVLSSGGYLSTFYLQVDNDGFDLNSLLIMEEDNLN